jgi:hypothetical protein
MQNKKNRRKNYFVDSQVQGALVKRVVLHWFLCMVALALLIFCWRTVAGPARMPYTHFYDLWFYYGPAVVGSLLLLPLVVFDVVRLSNRFVGPLVRLRRSLRALARGKEVAPLKFRKNDFWQEFAGEFNAVAERMNKLNRAAAADTDGDEAEEDRESVLAGKRD